MPPLTGLYGKPAGAETRRPVLFAGPFFLDSDGRGKILHPDESGFRMTFQTAGGMFRYLPLGH
jgi:hypothetical protein